MLHKPAFMHKKSEILQLVLDNFTPNQNSPRFLCNIAYHIHPSFGPIVSKIIREHGLSTSGDWSSNISLIVTQHHINPLDFSCLENTCRVVFLQLAIEKYKKMGD